MGRMCLATSEAVTAQKTMRPLLPNFWKERRDAMGLGDRGKNQVKKGSPSGLFARTEPSITEIQNSSNTQIQNSINTGIQEPLPEKNDQRKMYNILGHCRNVFASMLSMNAGRNGYSAGSTRRLAHETGILRRAHVADGTLQTLYPNFGCLICPPETAAPGSVD